MRMLKKVFLAAGLVGMIGSLGFAQEARAANEVTVEAELDTSEGKNVVTWIWANDDSDTYDLATKAVYYVGDQTFTTDNIAVTPGDAGGEYTCNIDDYISKFTTPKEGDQINGQVKVVVTVTNKDGTATGDGQNTTLDSILPYNCVAISSSDSTLGSVKVNGKKDPKNFYAIKGSSVTAVAVEEEEGSFKKWDDGETTLAHTAIKVDEPVSLVAKFESTPKVIIKGVTVTADKTTANVGDSVAFTATVDPSTAVLGTDYTISWNVPSELTIVSGQATNKLTTTAAKATTTAAKVTATVTATAGGTFADSADVTINGSVKPVTSAKITSNTAVEVTKGGSFSPVVSYEPTDASVTNIRWGYRKSGESGSYSGITGATGKNPTISTSDLAAGDYDVKAFVYYEGSAAPVDTSNTISLTVKDSTPKPVTKATITSSTTVSVEKGKAFTPSASYEPTDASVTEIKWGYRKSGATGNFVTFSNATGKTPSINIDALALGTFEVKAFVYYTGTDGKETSIATDNAVNLTVTESTDYVKSTLEKDGDQVEYITQGYSLEVKGTIKGTNRSLDDLKFEKTKGEGAKIRDLKVTKKDDNTNEFNFRIDASDCSVSSGETLEVKVKATVKNGKTATEDLVVDDFITVKVYPKPTLSFASDTRKFSYTAPTNVNTGTDDGKGDSDKDNRLTNFTGCKGVLIKVWNGDTSSDPLWTSTSAVSGGNSATINAESLVTALNNDKKLYGSGDFKFRIYPCNSSNKYNRHIYAETTIHIYKLDVTGIGVTAQNYYGLNGQEVEIKAVPIDTTKTWTADSYWMDDAAKKEGQTRKVKIEGADKTYTAVLGTRTTSDNSASGRAGVNKWGQSNVSVYFAVILVIGAVCLGLHLYDKKKKNI